MDVCVCVCTVAIISQPLVFMLVTVTMYCNDNFHHCCVRRLGFNLEHITNYNRVIFAVFVVKETGEEPQKKILKASSGT